MRFQGMLAALALGTATAQTAPHPPSTMHPAHTTGSRSPADRPPAPPQVTWSTNRASRRARERLKA